MTTHGVIPTLLPAREHLSECFTLNGPIVAGQQTVGHIYRRKNRTNWVAVYGSRIADGGSKPYTKKQALEALRRMMGTPSLAELASIAKAS